MAAITNENSIAHGGVHFLALFDLSFCAGKVTNFASVWERLPSKLGAMPLDIAYRALLGVDVREVKGRREALGRQLPVRVGHARLEEEALCTFNDGTVCALDWTIRFRAMRIRDVVSDTKFATHNMELRGSVTVPSFDCS
jgi:hypothetical protein